MIPHDLAISIISFIVLIGVMVVVHEFGHFAVAKLCGVRVEAFSIGFGPRLFGIKHGDTDYKVCVLPLGGYVKMTGESPEQNLETPGKPVAQHAGDNSAEAGVPAQYDPGSFTAHPRWQRMLIGVAGPIANFILAFVLMVGYYHWINEVPKHEATQTAIEWVVPGSPAAQAGLQTGDVIKEFGTARNPEWEQVADQMALNSNRTLPVTVARGGQSTSLSLHVPAIPKRSDFRFTDAGMWPQTNNGPIGVDTVEPGTPAQRAGLRAGDQIEKVDGLEFHDVLTLIGYMNYGQGKPITLTVLRNGAPMTIVATPAILDDGYKLGFAPAGETREDPLSWSASVGASKDFCTKNSLLIVQVLRGLFTNRVHVNQLSGPVGIARMAGQAAKRGWSPMIYLAGAISINLGILNLMPFPILDGGMILLLLIESVLRHDISLAVKERIYQAAFVVLVVFFAFVTFNDVSKLIFNHVKP
jgi:regulator of sigma E protease